MHRFVLLLLMLTDATLNGCVEAPDDAGDPPSGKRSAALRDDDAGSAADAAKEVSYETVDLATGLVRTAIVKRDPQRGVCARVVLVHGAGAGPFAAQVDGRAAVERAWISRELASCDSPSPAPPEGAVLATEVSGRVTLRARRDGGCSADVELVLSFSSGAPWVPASERMRVRGLQNSFACLVP